MPPAGDDRGGARAAPDPATAASPPAAPALLCPHYHEAVELLGRRWTGAIVEVLLQTPGRPLRFTEIAAAVPDLSDRLLSRRLKDLEERGIVHRSDHPGPPLHPRYALTPMGRELEPAVGALKDWGRRWLDTSASRFRPA